MKTNSKKFIFASASRTSHLVQINPSATTPVQARRLEHRMTIKEMGVALGLSFEGAVQLELMSDTLSARESLEIVRRLDAYAQTRPLPPRCPLEYRCSCSCWHQHAMCKHIIAVMLQNGETDRQAVS